MKLSLEQVFYGRGERGYAILGSSTGGLPFSSRVEALCGAVGTPAGDYRGEPFLVSVPDGDGVIMMCGRSGAPDSMGRSTLFYHVLIGLRKDLAAAKVDAFTLFDQGAFVAQMPKGRVDSLLLDARPSAMRRHPLGDDIPLPIRRDGIHFPAAIRSTGVPDPNEVREFVAGKSNEIAWATYAFHPLEGFDLQVLPIRSFVPANFNEYAGNMPMLSIGLVREVSSRSISIETDCTSASTENPSQQVTSENGEKHQRSRKSSFLLLVSLLANIALAVFCVVLVALRNRHQPSSSVTTSSPHSMPNEEFLALSNKVAVLENAKKTLEASNSTLTAMVEDLNAKQVGISNLTNEISQAALDEFRKKFPPRFTKEEGKILIPTWDENSETVRKLKQLIDFLETNNLGEPKP